MARTPGAPLGPMLNPAEWDVVWAEGIGPGERFDKLYPSPALVAAVKEGWMPAGSGVALVPGCGRGYDVELLARSDRFARVIGIDVAPTAARVARDYLSGRGLDPKRWDITCCNFFDFPAPAEKVEFILDYTFLCALPRNLREKWAARMRELIAPGGSLLTLMYPMGKTVEEGGPPHGVTVEDFMGLLSGKGFRLEDGPRMLPHDMCHKGREGRTGYARWLRVQ